MKEKYEISCLVNGKHEKGNMFLSEKQGKYTIRFEMKDYNILVEAENYFYALTDLRRKLEMKKIKLLCKGCSLNVYPSPMILSMGDATEAYQLFLGKHAMMEDLVNIFASCDAGEYSTVEEQLAYYEKWLKSKKG